MCKQCNCQSDEICSCGCHGNCDCGGYDGQLERRYQTKEEKMAELESYLSELKTEVQAVEEHLADLRK